MFKIGLFFFCISFVFFLNVSIPEDIEKEGETVWIWGDLTQDNLRYRYGYVRNVITTEMDAFLYVQDINSGDTLLDYRYDQGYYEEFVYLAVLSDGSFIVVSREHRIVYPSMIVKETTDELLLFSPSFLLQDKIRLDHIYESYGMVGDTLVGLFEGNSFFWSPTLLEQSFDVFVDSLHNPISYQGLAFLDNHSVTTLESSMIGNHQVEIDEGSFHFSFLWVIEEMSPQLIDSTWTVFCMEGCMIDEEWRVGSISITEVGNHMIQYEGVGGYSQTYDLTVEATYEGIVDEQRISEGVQIFSNASSMMMDGEDYASEWIHEVGTHELVLFGCGGYEKTISFTILPHSVGVTDGATYEYEVTFHVFGTALLNQRLVSEEVTVSQAGEYELVFEDEDGVSRILRFEVTSTLVPQPITPTPPETTSWLKYAVWGPLGIGAILILKKKTKKTSTMI